ncbi:sensor domain-containing diguanylate cyclase [Actinopolymorpha alba]|uniref:GGDEF domain-containing protein n=1 Tax=Actinopolymorpha alba TaxID=533267 RepID=UPI0003638787|nr:GGDEF domain-containing protein [Actinopolymorpha alba]
MVVDQRRGLRTWRLWSLSVPAITYLLLVDAVALASCVALALSGPPRVSEIGTAVTLCLCAVIGTEGARRVERRRRRGGALHKDLQPVWMLAAAVVLNPATALACVLVMRVWWRIRASRCIPHRWVFSTAVALLSTAAAHGVYDTLRETLLDARWSAAASVMAAVVSAAVTFIAIDTLVCAIAIRLLVPGSTPRQMFGEPPELAVDAVAGGLGCLVAAASMVSPWIALLAIPITLTGQRALLLDQLETEANTDGKTELASFPWWRQEVEDRLARARRRSERFGILLGDLDHFKRINDTHGHLIGDQALHAIAGRMRAAIRAEDLAGRFGGEEFVIGMPCVDASDAVGAAQRLRTAISGDPLAVSTDDGAKSTPGTSAIIRLTMSIGVAVFPEDGATLDELLEHADRALYAAKAAGRDRVSRGEVIFSPAGVGDEAGAAPVLDPALGPAVGPALDPGAGPGADVGAGAASAPASVPASRTP